MTTIYRKKNYTQGHLRSMIQEKRNQGMTYRKIQENLGIGSLATISKRAHQENGISKSSAPHTPAVKYDLEVLYQLYVLRKVLGLTIDDCYDHFQQNTSIDFKRSSIGYRLKERGLTAKAKRVYQKFKEYDPGFIHVDISYGPKLQGKKMYIYVAIDRATRLLYLEVHEDKKAETAAMFLKKALEFFPFVVTKVLTDNGKEFTSKNHLGKMDLEGLFDGVCKEYDIEHRLTLPYHPWTNGVVEKSNDTIKSNTVHINTYTTKEEMKQDMKRFLLRYTFERRHTSLIKEHKGRTPFDALCYYYEGMKEIFKENPIDFASRIRILCAFGGPE